MICAREPAGGVGGVGNAVQIHDKPESEQAEEDPRDLEPQDVADAGKGAKEAEDAAPGGFGGLSAGLHSHLAGGLVGLCAQSLCLLRQCLGLADGVRAVCSRLQALTGEAPGKAHPNAQFSAKFLRFHAASECSSGAACNDSHTFPLLTVAA